MEYAICGVDESGVGSIIGPIITAGVAIPSGSEGILKEWGVTDSKRMSSGAEYALYKQITDAPFLTCRTAAIQPPDIDMAAKTRRRKGRRRRAAEYDGIRQLMAGRAAEVIMGLVRSCSARGRMIGTAYVDSFDTDTARLEQHIAAHVSKMTHGARVPVPEIICRTGADRTMPIVSAASVVAGAVHKHEVQKVQREMLVGGGHACNTGPLASDSARMYRFIYDYYLRHGTLPAFVRASCRPMKRLVRHEVRHRHELRPVAPCIFSPACPPPAPSPTFPLSHYLRIHPQPSAIH